MASIQFSDTSNNNGLVELLSRATGTQSATTSSYPLKQKTVDINGALDQYLMIARKASPSIKIDDTNFTGEPLYTQTLTSGTQGYTFTTDASSAQIVEIDRVEVLTSSGQSKRLTLLNPENVGLYDDEKGLASYQSTNGEPAEYRIVGKNIYLYPAPNYTQANGLKLYHSRAPSYFVSTDTTKVAGINNIFHDYLWMRPAMIFALLKGLKVYVGLKNEVEKMEMQIADYFAKHNRDSSRMEGTQRMRPSNHPTK